MHFPRICKPKFQKFCLWCQKLGHIWSHWTKQTIKKLNLWEITAVDKIACIKACNTSDLPLGNSGLNRISHWNNNLIDESSGNIFCSHLDITDELKESLSDNIIVNSEFNCNAHIFEYTDDSNGNRNDNSNENMTLSNYFKPININETFTIEVISKTSRKNTSLDSKINDVNSSIFKLKDPIDQVQKLPHNFQNNVN